MYRTLDFNGARRSRPVNAAYLKVLFLAARDGVPVRDGAAQRPLDATCLLPFVEERASTMHIVDARCVPERVEHGVQGVRSNTCLFIPRAGRSWAPITEFDMSVVRITLIRQDAAVIITPRLGNRVPGDGDVEVAHIISLMAPIHEGCLVRREERVAVAAEQGPVSAICARLWVLAEIGHIVHKIASGIYLRPLRTITARDSRAPFPSVGRFEGNDIGDIPQGGRHGYTLYACMHQVKGRTDDQPTHTMGNNLDVPARLIPKIEVEIPGEQTANMEEILG